MLVYSRPSGPNDEVAAVVVPVRIADGQEDLARRRQRPRSVGSESRDRVEARLRRVGHVEPAVGRVARIEREAEKTLLPAVLDAVADVQEDGSPSTAQADHASRLLDDVDRSRLARRIREQHG